MNRREVIQRVLIGTTALIVIPSSFTNCSKEADPAPNPNPNPGPGPSGSKITLDLTLPENAVLNTTGGSKVVQTLLVVNTGTGYIAVSSICTHEGCTVAYDSATTKIKCPCHGSIFTTTGSVVSGLAPTSLASYQASKSGNILTITL